MIQIINRFFNSVKTIDDAMKLLNENKDFIYESYTNIQTKKILYSLIIYKFGNDFNCPDKLKKLARNIILYSLDTSKYPSQILHKEILIYIREFDLWKKHDMENILHEIAGSYINLNEMKNNIIRKNTNTEIDSEWIEKINNLMNKLSSYGNKLNPKYFNDLLEKFKLNINQQKETLAKNIVDDIYWTNFHNELLNNNYDLLYDNFDEIKNILNEIKHDNNIDEIMDLNYLKQLIEHNAFSPEYLSNYTNFITNKSINQDHRRILKRENVDQNILIKNITINLL